MYFRGKKYPRKYANGKITIFEPLKKSPKVRQQQHYNFGAIKKNTRKYANKHDQNFEATKKIPERNHENY